MIKTIEKKIDSYDRKTFMRIQTEQNNFTPTPSTSVIVFLIAEN